MEDRWMVSVRKRLAVGSMRRRIGSGVRDERLILFTRYPDPGQVKTRLIPRLGPEGAADVHREMTGHIVRVISPILSTGGRSLEICHHGGDSESMARWLGSDLLYRRQGEGDLGHRMAASFEEAFREGFRRVVIIGSDCPDLTGEILDRAFGELRRKDLVLGPASDGGYYLIGLRRPAPDLFRDVSWGMEDVLRTTQERAASLGLSMVQLPELADVDRPEDLGIWEGAKERSKPRISVIIPTLNESRCIAGTLSRIPRASNVELIVVDGGSTDDTIEVVSSLGVKVLTSDPSRARQMNLGASMSSGSILLFLHADTSLPDGFDRLAREACQAPGIAGGAFGLRIDSPRRALRVVEWGVRHRSRWMGMPYGDQALFVKASVFREMGGFPDMPFLEDLVFVRRLRRKGKVKILDASVVTSARRWLRLGVLRTWIVNQVSVLLYFLGVSPARIADFYIKCGRPERRAFQAHP